MGKGAREGITREEMTSKGMAREEMTRGDASNGHVSGLFYGLFLGANVLTFITPKVVFTILLKTSLVPTLMKHFVYFQLTASYSDRYI